MASQKAGESKVLSLSGLQLFTFIGIKFNFTLHLKLTIYFIMHFWFSGNPVKDVPNPLQGLQQEELSLLHFDVDPRHRNVKRWQSEDHQHWGQSFCQVRK